MMREQPALGDHAAAAAAAAAAGSILYGVFSSRHYFRVQSLFICALTLATGVGCC